MLKIKDTEIKLVKADITGLNADAIVNAANNRGEMGGGVAGAIRRKGGKVQYVIHAATMDMSFKTDEVKIRNACRNALRVADELKIKSIAFPALGCGVGGFTLLASAKIMSQEVWRYLREEESGLKEVIFCLYDQEAYAAFEKGAVQYLEHINHKIQSGPFTTVDAIIEIDGGIVLIQRSNPPFGWALPGGFVDYGESLEDAVVREAKEETGLDITGIKQFHTYSDPKRDPRFHTIGTVFIARAAGTPRGGDDAASAKIVKLSEIAELDLAFDHKKIIEDYLNLRAAASPRPPHPG